MEGEHVKPTTSGQTTPDFKSIFSRPRSNSQETVMTAITEATAESTPSLNYPGAPLNSPETQSLAGDTHVMMNVGNLAAKLHNMPGSLTTPPASEGDHHQPGKAFFMSGGGINIRDFGLGLPKSMKSTKSIALTSGLLKAEREGRFGTPAKKTLPEQVIVSGTATPEVSEFMEMSQWDTVAEEDVEKGLQRLAMLARDEHKKDRSKSVEHYYSERLVKLIKAAEIKFDSAALH